MEANKRIAACGQKKRLKEAIDLFEELIAEGLRPTVHTYTALMNAYVRNGDHAGARGLFNQMQAAGLEPNTVTFTTLLKSCCAKVDLTEAAELLVTMREKGVDINVRTINTFLRGCLCVGDIDRALDTFHSFVAEGALRADAPAFEAVVRLLAGALRTREAEALLAGLEVRSRGGGSSEELPPNLDPTLNPCPQLLLAESWAMLGNRKRARQSLERAEELLKGGPPTGHAGAGSLESVDLFITHRWQELQRDAESVAHFLDTSAPSGSGPVPGLAKSMGRFVYFRDPGLGDAARLAEVLESELDRAGLRGCRPRAAARARGAVRASLSGRGRLRVRSLMGVAAAVPVKVEICSGAGDWVVEQAKADADRAAWVALELRHDRCIQISRKAARADLSNLLVVGGDASHIVPRRLPKALATHVYVNFPEPPAWHEASGEVGATHLLTKRFLRSLSRLLVPGGALIIVSDNRSYLTSLMEAAGGLPAAFREAASTDEGGGRLRLEPGLPGVGEDTGLSAPFGESYFHRLWAMGSKKQKRFHLRLTRPSREGSNTAE
mmetsp:Transcript_68832/g.197370  ORF Transcript_68832/g.197370 Transcript_68832/m.197370 type:complete len:552 (-) Transcript_68832:48-1703(-)